jgi:hypothetical protein
MGKMALLVVLGLSMAVGIIAYTINLSKKQLAENVVGFDKYTTARNIAHTGVNMMLRRMDRGDTSIVNKVNRGEIAAISINVMAGQCSVYMKLKNPPPSLDTVDMTSKSRFMDSSYKMILRLKRTPKPFPEVGGALSIASQPFGFNMNGNPHIYGENYNMDGTRGNTALDTNGVAVTSSAESSTVATEAGSRITGDPKSVVVNPVDNPISYVNEYISGADVVFANGSNNTGNYGSPTNPVIGYADGTVKFGGSGKFYGVLVVHGTIEFVGTFDFYGLVIAYGDDNVINVSTTSGNPQIWGAMIVTGAPGSNFRMNGTADIRYSVEALNMAHFINKMQAYQVIWWFE